MSTTSLPEYWTELNAARKNKRSLFDSVTALKTSAQADGVNDIVRDPKWHAEAMDKMLARYKHSQDREWFSNRGAVVVGLENMFAEAKELKTSLEDIERNIGSEKEAWYRWVLRNHPEFLALAESGVDQDEVRSILDDPDRSREELVAIVSRAIGMPEDWSDRVDVFVEKMAKAENEEEVRRICIQEFFKDRQTGATLEHAQPYLKMYELDTSMSLENVIDKIIAANREERSTQSQRDTLQRRLDELQRAKAAVDQNKVRNKSQQQGTAQKQPDERYYNLPPCPVCGKDMKDSEFRPCPPCQIGLYTGGSKDLTAYCSDACFDKGWEEHMLEKHDCIAGRSCIQESSSDDALKDEPGCAMACNECLDRKQVELFCTMACAQRNLATHRREKHDGAETDVVKDLVSPMDQLIDLILTEDKTGLKKL